MDTRNAKIISNGKYVLVTLLADTTWWSYDCNIAFNANQLVNEDDSEF